jgi:predicted NBD/HSP70 family sugar kinase
MAELRGGIDLGGTKIQTAIVDAGGEVLEEARHPTPTSGGPVDVARAMEDALREAASAAGVEPGALQGVGVGSPGDANGNTGVVSGARNLPGLPGGLRRPRGEGSEGPTRTRRRVRQISSRSWRSAARERLTSSVWEHAMREKDPLTESLIRRAVRYPGTGIATACNLLDVEAVVIGGASAPRSSSLTNAAADDHDENLRQFICLFDCAVIDLGQTSPDDFDP